MGNGMRLRNRNIENNRTRKHARIGLVKIKIKYQEYKSITVKIPVNLRDKFWFMMGEIIPLIHYL